MAIPPLLRRRPIRLLAVPVLALGLLGACADDDDDADDLSVEVEEGLTDAPLDQDDEEAEEVLGDDEAIAADQTMVEEEAVFTDPGSVIGSDLTFTGDPGEAVGDNAFLLAFGGGELLVLTEEVPQEELPEGAALEVTGEVVAFDQAVVEDELGFEWTPELEGRSDPIAVVADSIEAVDEVPDEEDPTVTTVDE